MGKKKKKKWCKGSHSPLADGCPVDLQAMATLKNSPDFIAEYGTLCHEISL